MCARYKGSDAPTPGSGSGRAGRAQAPPRSRVQPTRGTRYPEEEPEEFFAAEEDPRYTNRFHLTEEPPRPPAPPSRRAPARYAEERREEPRYDDRRYAEEHYPDSRRESAYEPYNEHREQEFVPYRPLGADENPLHEFSRAPKPRLGCLGAIWVVVSLPFRIIAFLTRHLPKLILWPIRLAISLSFVGALALLFMAIIYGVKAGRYDITQVLHMPERTIVLDRKGTEIGTLHGENRRSIANLNEEVPRYFINALIMQEDRSFWTHGGIDPRGMLRAVAQVFKHHRTTQGGSTLTMQLAKNTYNHRLRSFDAKFTEMVLARRIEATYDKETILRCYINRVFWGHTFLGLKQAASGYFDKQPRDLTIGEAAMLAGIICSPNEFSPYRKPSAAKIQRDKVLKLMAEHGHITRREYEAALAEPIVCRQPERRGTNNYALDLVRSEVDHALSLLDARDQRIKDDAVISGGLRVKTTLDVDLQDDIMHALDAQLVARLEKDKKYPHQTRAQYQAQRAALPPEQRDAFRPKYVQAACAVVDNATGAMMAVVGGRDSEESKLNRAQQSRRPVGSIFKPIVYSTFFDRGGSPQTSISDDRLQPGEIAGAKNWNPHNSDNRFTGLHPASWGLLKSRNTMSIRIGNRAGLQNVVSSALMAGFPRPLQSPGPTIYLGTWEASPVEVAAAYTIFANGGVRPTPYIIESITDTEGRVIWQHTPSSRRVFSQRTAVATSGILQQITKPGGTAGSVQKLGFKAPCGGKTGTTNGYKNAWFCGFTSDLTAAVWVGFDRPVKIADKAYGGTLAMPLWVSVMQCAEKRGYPMGEIRTTPAKPARQSGLRLCRVSGMFAHSGCEYEGTAYTETMADTSKPRGVCTVHDELAEDPDAAPDDDTAEDPDEMPDEDVAEEV